MKTIKQIACFVIGLCLMLTCSGCFLLTRKVSHLGERHEILQARQILVATNGAVAIACTAHYYPSDMFGNAVGPADAVTVKKFLLGSTEVFHWTAMNAVAAKVKAARVAESARFKSNQPRLPENENPTNLVEISQLTYGLTNLMSWSVVPNGFGGRDATAKDLPEEFGGVLFTSKNLIVPFKLDGQDLQLRLPGNYSNASRTSRKWWGYPAQILVLPAMAVDIVGWPFELHLLVKSASEIH